MLVNQQLEELQAIITEAIDSGDTVSNDAEDKANRLKDIVSDIGSIKEDLEANQAALENLQDNLDALEAQKREADDLGIYN